MKKEALRRLMSNLINKCLYQLKRSMFYTLEGSTSKEALDKKNLKIDHRIITSLIPRYKKKSIFLNYYGLLFSRKEEIKVGFFYFKLRFTLRITSYLVYLKASGVRQIYKF